MQYNNILKKLDSTKIIIIDIVLVLLFTVLPYSISDSYNKVHDDDFSYVLQYLVSSISIIGSYLLIKFNNRLFKLDNLRKWPLYLFNVLGILLIAINLLVVFVVYFFRTPPGF